MWPPEPRNTPSRAGVVRRGGGVAACRLAGLRGGAGKAPLLMLLVLRRGGGACRRVAGIGVIGGTGREIKSGLVDTLVEVEAAGERAWESRHGDSLEGRNGVLGAAGGALS